MRLRFGIGKKVGPFFVGFTFGGKGKRKVVARTRVVKVVKKEVAKKEKTAKQPKNPEERWRNKPLFWWILCGLFGLSAIAGVSQYAQTGFGSKEVFAVIAMLALSGFFAYTAMRKSKSGYIEHENETVPVLPGIGLVDIDRMNGIEFENYCARLLESNGYSNVTVTPPTNDQGVDVLAEKDGIKYAIQCKNYSSSLGNTPIQEVNAGRIIYGCHIGVVMTNSTFTQGARTAADATGTLLWDRQKLESMIRDCARSEADKYITGSNYSS